MCPGESFTLFRCFYSVFGQHRSAALYLRLFFCQPTWKYTKLTLSLSTSTISKKRKNPIIHPVYTSIKWKRELKKERKKRHKTKTEEGSIEKAKPHPPCTRRRRSRRAIWKATRTRSHRGRTCPTTARPCRSSRTGPRTGTGLGEGEEGGEGLYA